MCLYFENQARTIFTRIKCPSCATDFNRVHSIKLLIMRQTYDNTIEPQHRHWPPHGSHPLPPHALRRGARGGAAPASRGPRVARATRAYAPGGPTAESFPTTVICVKLQQSCRRPPLRFRIWIIRSLSIFVFVSMSMWFSRL